MEIAKAKIQSFNFLYIYERNKKKNSVTGSGIILYIDIRYLHLNRKSHIISSLTSYHVMWRDSIEEKFKNKQDTWKIPYAYFLSGCVPG